MFQNWAEVALLVGALIGTALALSLVLTGLAIRRAPGLGLLDKPSERKAHSDLIPRAGGIAISLAMAGTFLLWTDFFPWPMFANPWSTPLAICLGILLIVGLLDDLYGLPWLPRLLIHFALAAFFLIQQTDFAEPFSWPILALGIFWLALLTNAFNMIDGMDLLAGGTGFLIGGAIFLAGLFYPSDAVIWSIPLLGALAGFLFFNRPPGRIFLGEAGSTTLGFLLASLSLVVVLGQAPHWKQFPALLFLFLVPVYDLVTVVGLRLFQGKSPFKGDRQHLAHRLLGQGHSQGKTLALMFGLTIGGILSGLGILLTDNELLMTSLLIWQSGGIVGFFLLEYTSGSLTPVSAKEAATKEPSHR